MEIRSESGSCGVASFRRWQKCGRHSDAIVHCEESDCEVVIDRVRYLAQGPDEVMGNLEAK